MKCKGCKHYQPFFTKSGIAYRPLIGACDYIVDKNPVEYIGAFDGELEIQYMEVSEDFYCAYWEKD